MRELKDGRSSIVRRLKSYRKYKDSGVEWLGEIPAYWEVRRVRFIADCNPARSALPPPETEVSFVPMEAIGEYGGLQLGQLRPIEAVQQGYTFFQDGDIIIAKITPCFENGKGAIASRLEAGTGFGTTELHVLRPSLMVDKRFLFYSTISQTFRKLGEAEMYGAGGQKRVPEDFVRDFRQPLPPLYEQRTIADFLDRETARIDALVAKKERLIELLQEKRTAIITHAVTKGLDPNAPMKDSGSEWLGSAPSHWVVKQLKFAATLQRGHDLPEQEREPGEVPIVSSAGPSGYNSRAAARGPGVITGRYGTVGQVFYVEQDYWPLNTTLYVTDFRGNDPKFIALLLSILPIGGYSAKSAVPGIDRNDIHVIPCAVPPRYEQSAIIAFVEEQVAKIDGLVGKVRDGFERFKEYRCALISAAVTGKIDVREAPALASD